MLPLIPLIVQFLSGSNTRDRLYLEGENKAYKTIQKVHIYFINCTFLANRQKVFFWVCVLSVWSEFSTWAGLLKKKTKQTPVCLRRGVRMPNPTFFCCILISYLHFFCFSLNRPMKPTFSNIKSLNSGSQTRTVIDDNWIKVLLIWFTNKLQRSNQTTDASFLLQFLLSWVLFSRQRTPSSPSYIDPWSIWLLFKTPDFTLHHLSAVRLKPAILRQRCCARFKAELKLKGCDVRATGGTARPNDFPPEL